MNLKTSQFWAIAIVVALLVLSRVETPSVASSSAPCPIEPLAAEFRTLQMIRGHFGGSTWNEDVDKWDGRKHQVMIQLGSCLGTGIYSKSEIIQWLGTPDKIAVKGEFLFSMVQSDRSNKLAVDSELLIYKWRGFHDFLYFNCQGERVINSSWWFAGE